MSTTDSLKPASSPPPQVRPDSINLPNAVSNLDPLLRRAYAHFGWNDTVLTSTLVANLFTSAEMTIEASHATSHQNKLIHSDIAVVCGPSSKNLCAIRFTDPNVLAQFLNNNPPLGGTLRTKTPLGIFLWIRVQGEYPASRIHPEFLWIARETIPILSRTSLSLYKFDGSVVPIALKFHDIRWPDDFSDALEQEQFLADYPPFIADKDGKAVLSDRFVVALYRRQNDIHFDPATQTFYRQTGTHIQSIFMEEVQQGILAMLESNGGDAQDIYIDASMVHVRNLADQLKITATKPLLNEDQVLAIFVRDHLELHEGANVAIRELFHAYKTHCAAKGYRVLSQQQFERRVSEVVRQEWAICKSNTVPREHGSVRGFKNIRLKEQNSETENSPMTAMTAMTGGGKKFKADIHELLRCLENKPGIITQQYERN